ncbi:MAG TPA: hypothetical protein VFD27_02995 [Chthoniobacteraceae bacterium]|nr:hypothetical protein [Chthoniobacteraceae bacterium]
MILLLFTGRRRPKKRITLTIHGRIGFNGHQVVSMSIVDRERNIRLCIDAIMSFGARMIAGSEYGNRMLLSRNWYELRKAWRDQVLPPGWRERGAMRRGKIADREWSSP